jgi:hypothetical protein
MTGAGPSVEPIERGTPLPCQWFVNKSAITPPTMVALRRVVFGPPERTAQDFLGKRRPRKKLFGAIGAPLGVGRPAPPPLERRHKLFSKNSRQKNPVWCHRGPLQPWKVSSAARFSTDAGLPRRRMQRGDAGSAFAAYITGNVGSNLIGRLISAALADHFGLAWNFYLFRCV